ncbi:hypothetical protein C4K40_6085 [Pseudomonas sp. CMR5c]|nr:hypothetical protein C4K40_6085 [Pseudomonas sp. CMR5c]
MQLLKAFSNLVAKSVPGLFASPVKRFLIFIFDLNKSIFILFK